MIIEKKYKNTKKIYSLIGITKAGLIEYKEALLYFLKSLSKLKYMSKNSEIYYNIGAIYYLTKNYKLSELFIKKSIHTNLKNPNNYNILSMIEFKKKKYKNALILINKAIKIDNNESFFYNNKGYIYIKKKKFKKSKKNINKSINMNHKNT